MAAEAQHAKRHHKHGSNYGYFSSASDPLIFHCQRDERYGGASSSSDQYRVAAENGGDGRGKKRSKKPEDRGEAHQRGHCQAVREGNQRGYESAGNISK